MPKSFINPNKNIRQKRGKSVYINDGPLVKDIKQTDKELWTAFKAGSLIAYKLIYERNIDSLFKYGKTLAPFAELAQDGVQDLFVDLWNKRANLGNVDNIKGYLFISYRRKLLDLIKKQKKILNIENLNSFNILLTESNNDSHLSDEKKALILTGLNNLSDQKKEAIYLRFFNNLSCIEIGEIMKINTQSVYNLISTGLKTIKNSILFVILLLGNLLI